MQTGFERSYSRNIKQPELSQARLEDHEQAGNNVLSICSNVYLCEKRMKKCKKHFTKFDIGGFFY